MMGLFSKIRTIQYFFKLIFIIIKLKFIFIFSYRVYSLTKLAEIGIQQRQIKRWESPKPQCFANVLSAESLTINEFAPHLFILTLGMVLALVIFILEKIKNSIREMDVPNF